MGGLRPELLRGAGNYIHIFLYKGCRGFVRITQNPFEIISIADVFRSPTLCPIDSFSQTGMQQSSAGASKLSFKRTPIKVSSMSEQKALIKPRDFFPTLLFGIQHFRV